MHTSYDFEQHASIGPRNETSKLRYALLLFPLDTQRLSYKTPSSDGILDSVIKQE